VAGGRGTGGTVIARFSDTLGDGQSVFKANNDTSVVDWSGF